MLSPIEKKYQILSFDFLYKVSMMKTFQLSISIESDINLLTSKSYKIFHSSKCVICTYEKKTSSLVAFFHLLSNWLFFYLNKFKHVLWIYDKHRQGTCTCITCIWIVSCRHSHHDIFKPENIVNFCWHALLDLSW